MGRIPGRSGEPLPRAEAAQQLDERARRQAEQRPFRSREKEGKHVRMPPSEFNARWPNGLE
jgi:hypothetical protein